VHAEAEDCFIGPPLDACAREKAAHIHAAHTKTDGLIAEDQLFEPTAGLAVEAEEQVPQRPDGEPLDEERGDHSLASGPGGDIADRRPLPLARCREPVGKRS
jgi:hypothetical protein